MFRKRNSWDNLKKRSRELLGKTSIRDADETSFVATCVEVYPDFCMAKVESVIMGTRIIPYHPDSGIMAPSTVLVDVWSMVPRISRVLSLGYTPSKTIVMDFDVLDGESSKEYMYKQSSVPDWGPEQGDKLAHLPITVKHEEGEKVFNVLLSGLKLGYKKTTLFYNAQSRIELFKNTVEIIGISTSILSKAGIKKFVFDNDKEDAGYILENVYDRRDDVFFQTVREYKGNVSKAMSDEKLSINDIYPSEAASLISTAVYMFIVLDYEKDDYDFKVSEVNHKYQNRTLEIIGSAKDADLLIHSKLKKKLKLTDKFLENKALLATIDGDDYPITYLKIITQKGDKYEYIVGDNFDIIRGKDVSLSIGPKRENYFLGDKYEYVQGNINEQHYPVKLDSYHKYEYFGKSINIYKGDFKATYFRRQMNKMIFTMDEYEVDEKSGIETMRRLDSPMNIETMQARTTDFKDMKLAGSKIFDIQTIKDEDGIVTIMKDGTTIPFSVEMNKAGNKTSLMLMDESFMVEAKKNTNIKSENIMLDSKQTVTEGKLFVNDGLYVKGVYIVDAEDIIMLAKNYFMVDANNIMLNSHSGIQMLFSDSFYAQSTATFDGNNADHVATGIQLTSNSFQAQADSVTIFGEENVSVTAKDTASFGAERTYIFGLGEGENI